MFKWHSLTLQKAPFRPAIKPISGAEKHHIAPWYGLNQTAKWALSENKINIFGLWYRLYQKTLQPEYGIIMPYLTFLYTYFPKSFCQNKVKKICNFGSIVFYKSADIKRGKKYGKHLSYWQGMRFPFAVMIYPFRYMNSLLRQNEFIVTWIPWRHNLYHPCYL